MSKTLIIKFSLILYFLGWHSSCSDYDSKYDYPVGKMTCPMEYRLEWKDGEIVGIDDSQNCEFIFNSKHNQLEFCPRCGTPLSFIRANHKLEQDLFEKARRENRQVTAKDFKIIRDKLKDFPRDIGVNSSPYKYPSMKTGKTVISTVDSSHNSVTKYACRRCGSSFSSIQNARGKNCPDAPVITKTEPNKYRSQAEVDRLLGPPAGNTNSRWSKPLLGYNGITNIEQVDPRTVLKPVIGYSGQDQNAYYRKYLADKLNSFKVIKGRSWEEYPQGRGHDLIKSN